MSLLIVATWPLVRRRDIERPSTSTQPPGVAHHEAGHAVAAWYFGYPIDFVTIDPAEDFACRCIASPVLKKDGASETDVKPDDYVKVLKAIDVCLAGREADAVCTGRRHWSGSRRDLVVKYTEEIDAVTRALLEHRRLTGNEIRVAINSALARRPTPLNVEGNESL